jgi:hypothetical protein
MLFTQQVVTQPRDLQITPKFIDAYYIGKLIVINTLTIAS